MSRLGELLKAERLRHNLSIKKVAKLGGISEQYLQSVEAGTKIIADDLARQILKKMGIKSMVEANFTLDEIATTVDINTIKPNSNSNNDQKTESINNNIDKTPITGSVWLDALSSVLKKVPVYNSIMKQIDTKLVPAENGKIHNFDFSKVFYFIMPDDEMNTYRLRKGDVVFIVPATSPIDNAIMLVKVKNHYMVRKILQLDIFNVAVQSFGMQSQTNNYNINDITILGKCISFESTL